MWFDFAWNEAKKNSRKRVLRERCLKKDDGLEHSLDLSLELLL